MNNYYSIPAISSSSLAYIDAEKGGSWKRYANFLKEDNKEEPSYFKFGRMFHSFILEPQKFTFLTINVSDTIKEIIDQTITALGNDFEGDESNDLFNETVISTARSLNYNSRIVKNETYLNNILNVGKGLEYYNAVLANKHLIVVSKTQHETMKLMADSLSLDEYKHIKDLILTEEFSHFDSYSEQIIEFTFMGEKCKSLLDKIIVNNKEKTIINVDLKTTAAPINMYNEKFFLYDTDRQMAFYRIALSKFAEETGKKDYKLISKIAAVEKTSPYEWKLFDIKEETINNGLKSIQELITEIKVARSKMFIEDPIETEI